MVRSRHFRRLRVIFSGKEGQAVIDYQEELDRYLEQIGELAHNKEYADCGTCSCPWSLPTSPCCWRNPALS